MNSIRSELTKLLTAPMAYALAGLAIVLTMLPVLWLIVDGSAGEVSFAGGGRGQAVGIAGVAPFFALGVGLLGITSEFQHGTAVASFLATPQRWKVVLAKAAVYSIAGALVVVTAGLALFAVLHLYGALQGVAVTWSASALVEAFVAGAAHGALFAVLGLGIGAIVANQTLAAVIALVWFLVAEEGLTLFVGEAAAEWLPGSLASTLSGGGSAQVGRVVAAAALAAYAVALTLAGSGVVERREVG